MKNINEEVKRIRVLMGLNANIQNNNFAQMGLTRKTISRGGVMYQEQDVVDGVDTTDDTKSDFDKEVEARKDAFEKDVMDYRKEVSDKVDDVESEEEKRQADVVAQKEKSEEENEKKEEEELEKKELEKREKEEKEAQKKEELEARLAAQRERTT